MKPILNKAKFSVAKGSKITLMGQNGCGKSTIFKLITGQAMPDDGHVHVMPGAVVAIAQQVMPPALKGMDIDDYLKHYYRETKASKGFHATAAEALKSVALDVRLLGSGRIVSSFSGGQQARLLLASCFVQDPDIILMDEPTNNLDTAGIGHLTSHILGSEKTMLVISHDADFLNSFTDGVLYLDKWTQSVEQYNGDYFDVCDQIEAKIEKQNLINTMQKRTIQAKVAQAEKFANKGGGMRKVAKRMRGVAAKASESMVEVRKEDEAIKSFTFPSGRALRGDVVHLSGVTIREPDNGFKQLTKEVSPAYGLKSRQRLRLSGPNGVGKTTLLEALAGGKEKGAVIHPKATIGYYRQDFSSLDFEQTVLDSLLELHGDQQHCRSVAASFQLYTQHMNSKIGTLSEGQKGLVAFCQLTLQQPDLLILDEPTNHINFRHLPVIAEALNQYEGAMVIVSHDAEFVSKIRIDKTIDLGGL